MRAYFLSSLLLWGALTGHSQQTAGGSVSFAGSVSASSVPAAVVPTPAMGWNSWLYLFDTVAGQNLSNPAWQPTESFIHQQSDAMKATLGSYGYTLLSVDGGWGDRDGSGNVRAVPGNFPSGAAALGAYIHNNGQQFGLYGTVATGCLTGYAEQYQHEAADAAAMVGFGVDYFKYDLCGASGGSPLASNAALRAETDYLFRHFVGRPVATLT